MRQATVRMQRAVAVVLIGEEGEREMAAHDHDVTDERLLKSGIHFAHFLMK